MLEDSNNGQEDAGSGLNVGEQDLEDDEDEDDDEDEILEEDDAEFNDIIDHEGILVGEDLLMNDYQANDTQADQQRKLVSQMYQRDKERKSQANVSHSNIGRSSPYQGPDGRPPIRPITPLKSSQTTRV